MFRKVVSAVFVATYLLFFSAGPAASLQGTESLPFLWSYINNQNSGLTDDSIGLIEFDKFENAWFVGWDGLSVRRANGTWEHFTPDNSALVEAPGWSLSTSPNGDVWVGTRSHGAFRLNGDGTFTNFTTANSILESNWIHAIKVLPNGDVLLGTIGPGNLYILKTDGSWIKTNIGQEVLDIQYDLNGAIWLGTLAGDLIRMDETGVLTFYDPPCTRDLNNIAFASNGWIWLATHDGICGVDPTRTQWKRFIPDGVFAAITVDRNGVVWAGDVNGLGLFSYDPTIDTLTNYTTSSTGGKLPSNIIYTPVIDACGRIWMGTIGSGVTILSKGYSISGHVFDENHLPMEGVTVSGENGHQASTDQNGYYCIDAVPNGTYTLKPQAGNFVPAQRVVLADQQLISDQDFMAVGNSLPEIVELDDLITYEGTELVLDAEATDNDGDVLTFSWDLDNDGEYDDSTGVPTDVTFYDDGVYTVGLKVSDEAGAFATDSMQITVSNVAPTVNSISAPMDPQAVGTGFYVGGAFEDPGTDSWLANWNWGDGSTTAGILTDKNVYGFHTYSVPGVYVIKLTITDDDGGTGMQTFQYLVAYDPNSGFVTGGGQIYSPLGAYPQDPSLTGKASFGFVAKYQKGASIPEGNTEFEFKIANLAFTSTSLDWLVVAGNKAQYKGTGTINGLGNYGFLLTALDASPDRFRIKIWDKLTGNIIYDNMIGTADGTDPVTRVEAGQIVIHKTK